MDPKLLAAIIAVLMGLASVLGAVATYIKSRSELVKIKADREKTKNERDTEIALLKQKVAIHDEMMKNGIERFERVEKELKENNGLLRELLGMFKMSVRAKDHAPPSGPCVE